MPENRQWKGKTDGGVFGQQFLLHALRRIPVKVFYPVLYLIIPFCLLFARKANRPIYQYYRQMIGLGKWDAFRGNVRTAFVFGRVVLDKFAIWAGNKKQFQIHRRHEDEALIDQLLSHEKGFIFAGSHIGNFELMGQAMEQDRKRINCIIFGGESRLVQSHRDEVFEKNNVNLIPVSADMSHLFAIKEALDKGEVVAILSDRMFDSNKKETVPFLGHPADFPIGIFRIAAMLDVPIISAFMLKMKGTHYQCHLVPLECPTSEKSSTAKAKALLFEYVHSLESVLKEHPEQWFNFFDFWHLEEMRS